jgi:hypothetical protein
MDINIKEIIESSKGKAEKLLNFSGEIRKAYAVGRPNSAKESTAEGALEALAIIVSKFNPGYERNVLFCYLGLLIA